MKGYCFKLKESTPPCPRAAGPRAWRDARGEPRQENQKTEIRKRKGKEIEKERKKRKQIQFYRKY